MGCAEFPPAGAPVTWSLVTVGALIILAMLVKVLDLDCWGVETYTISVSADLPNIAPELDLPAPAPTPVVALPSPAVGGLGEVAVA